MNRRLPQSGQLFRTLLFCDVVAGACVYGAWRWAERNEAALLRAPSSRLWVELVLAVCGALFSALLTRWSVYRRSSWEPSFLAALAAVATTPLIGAPLLRSIALAE